MTRPLSLNDRAIKEKELKWFKACQVLCSLFPSGEPEQNPSHAPEPDILFRDIRLGIEITEYSPKQPGGSPVRESEVMRDRLLEAAKKVFERSNNERFLVSISWDPHQKFSSKADATVAEQIAQTVNGMLANGVQLWEPDWKTAEGKSLGRHVGSIEIWPRHAARGWVSVESGTGGDDVRRVQETIRGKEPYASKYRNACDQVWLLIVAEARFSTYFSPDEDFPRAVFETSFNRVFLFDAFHNQVRNLATRDLHSR